MKVNSAKNISDRQTPISWFMWLLIIALLGFLLVGIFWPPQIYRESALKAKDMSNLRQIAFTMYEYAADNDGVLAFHPKEFERSYGMSHEAFLNPYQDDDLIVERNASYGSAIRYGGYVLLRFGENVDEIEEPQIVILGYTAKVIPEQDTRSVVFLLTATSNNGPKNSCVRRSRRNLTWMRWTGGESVSPIL